MNGINTITDEKGNTKALILDLIYFKKENISAEKVLENLKNLQELINEAGIEKNNTNSWDNAKSKLNQLKDLK